jgi:serine/threonine-protein kinase
MAGNDDGPVTQPSDPTRYRATNGIPVGEAFAGKYRIEGIQGSGGMGTVLRARHIQLGRPVALKIMHVGLLASEEAVRRFALEARATSVLKSAHAVRILDVDRAPSGAPFIVMELLDGQDLAALVTERGPLTVARTIHYLLQAADAIAEAHAHGLVHRDLKPNNLFLTKDGVVKVLDFGLVKAVRPATSAAVSWGTAANTLVGTPHYMSPEQIVSGRVDERTDIWGLGATFFHLLAGGPPFPAENIATLAALIVSQALPRIAERRADVSAAVDAVIARCMSKKPEERYPTVAAFQAALIHLRVELHRGPSRAPAAAAGATMREAPLGTLLSATRREPSLAELGSNVARPAPPPEPALGETRRAPLEVPWESDDEPTEISMPPDEDENALASTRKR